MVRRQVPLTRRLRANRGRILGFAVWAAAALTCLVLYPNRPVAGTTVAVAVVRQYPVLPPESGRLASVAVQPGAFVRAGEELAVVEIPGLRQQLAAAEANVRSLEATISLEAADRGRKFARDAEEAHARWLSANVELEASRASLAGVDADLNRLSSTGVETPEAVLEGLRIRHRALTDEVAARQREVAQLESSWQAARSRAELSAGEALAAQLDAARAEYDALQALAEACVLRASVDGLVGTVYGDASRGSPVGNPSFVAPGQWVQAGVPVLTLTESISSEAIAYVPPSAARELASGRRVSLLGEDGTKMNAEVHAVGAAVEAVPLRQLRDPAIPQWGIPVTLHVLDRALLPGEALAVEF